jgi:hypothetical protein
MLSAAKHLLFLGESKQKQILVALRRKSSNRSVIPRSAATRNLLLREEHKKQISPAAAGSE